ncbi:MAG: hypothetical protein LBC98_10815 [Prevotellaceae bacterium]|jgi:hypothetical protein|nr:hypothetical protein [Prevotellaceae bacterium]
MSKKKVKVNRYTQQKQDAAKYKKEYFMRLKHICDLLHPDLYPNIPEAQKQAIFLVRGTTVKVTADEKVPKKIREFADMNMRCILMDEKLSLYKGGPEVSMRDYIQLVFPLEIALIPVNGIDKFSIFIEQFLGEEWYIRFEEGKEDREVEFQKVMQEIRVVLSFTMSDMRHVLYNAVCDWHTAHRAGTFASASSLPSATMLRTMQIIPIMPEYKKIKLRGSSETRRGVRLSIVIHSDDPFDDNHNVLTTIELPPSHFGFKGAWAKKALPVYATLHALNRLEERLGCVYPAIIQRDLIGSIVTKHPIIRMRTGELLIEYWMYEVKVGYLVVSIQEDGILIHTFLLLTNTGTPEGSLLYTQFGLKKLDTQYLGLDKLTTFLYSDIFDHEDLREIFRKANCESLIKVKERLEDDWFWQQKGEHIELAIRMRDYLKKDEPEKWLPDNESIADEAIEANINEKSFTEDELEMTNEEEEPRL